MDQTERFYKIETLLRRRKSVGFAELLAVLEVSRSTLKRDLDYLRNRMHAPIVWDRTIRGYRFEEPAGIDQGSHALPGLWFSASEIHALLTVLHLLENLDSGALLRSHIEPLTERLNALLSSADTASSELRRRVRIIGLAQRAVPPVHFERVGSALAQRKRLKLTYAARGTGQTSRREVSPLRLVHYRSNWYLDAWCHLRDELRNFSLDAITQASVMDEVAAEISDVQLDEQFSAGYGIFSGVEVQWAQLRFSMERARWTAHEQWHPQQHGAWLPDGGYELRVPYADHRELLMDILKHGAHCEVVAPAGLRDVVRQEVAALHAKYG